MQHNIALHNIVVFKWAAIKQVIGPLVIESLPHLRIFYFSA